MDASRIHDVPLFSDLRRKDRKHVAQWADEVDVPAGAHLANEGEYAHEFFVISQGTAEVTIGGEHVTDLGPGDFFGEMALLGSDHHRTASVTAKTPMRLVVMFQKEFASMAADMPEVAEQLSAAIKVRRAADTERGE